MNKMHLLLLFFIAINGDVVASEEPKNITLEQINQLTFDDLKKHLEPVFQCQENSQQYSQQTERFAGNPIATAKLNNIKEILEKNNQIYEKINTLPYDRYRCLRTTFYTDLKPTEQKEHLEYVKTKKEYFEALRTNAVKIESIIKNDNSQQNNNDALSLTLLNTSTIIMEKDADFSPTTIATFHKNVINVALYSLSQKYNAQNINPTEQFFIDMTNKNPKLITSIITSYEQYAQIEFKLHESKEQTKLTKQLTQSDKPDLSSFHFYELVFAAIKKPVFLSALFIAIIYGIINRPTYDKM
jgi:hypothetical protein